MKIHETKFITLVIYDPLIIVINFTYLCLVIFCYFDTFLDGWVGGWLGGLVDWVKIKINYHLSPAEAGVEG